MNECDDGGGGKGRGGGSFLILGSSYSLCNVFITFLQPRVSVILYWLICLQIDGPCHYNGQCYID